MIAKKSSKIRPCLPIINRTAKFCIPCSLITIRVDLADSCNRNARVVIESNQQNCPFLHVEKDHRRGNRCHWTRRVGRGFVKSLNSLENRRIDFCGERNNVNVLNESRLNLGLIVKPLDIIERPIQDATRDHVRRNRQIQTPAQSAWEAPDQNCQF